MRTMTDNEREFAIWGGVIGLMLFIITWLSYDMITESETLFYIFTVAWSIWVTAYGLIMAAILLPPPPEWEGLTPEEVAQLLAEKEEERRRKREFKKLVKKEKRRKLFRAIFDVSLPVEVRNYRDYREWD